MHNLALAARGRPLGLAVTAVAAAATAATLAGCTGGRATFETLSVSPSSADGAPAAAGGSAQAAAPAGRCAALPGASAAGLPAPVDGGAPADGGPESAEVQAQLQGALASLAAMREAAIQLRATADGGCRAAWADAFASGQASLAGQLQAAAVLAIDDASGADADAVAALAQASAQLASALSKLPGVPMAALGRVASASAQVAQTPAVARGTAMSAASHYFTVPWGTGTPAGSNPSSSNAGFSPHVPAAGPDGSLVTAARPALPGGAAGGWVNHLGTRPFGTAAQPTIAFTAHQGGEGNCSELSGFNAVAAIYPKILTDHLRRVGVTADGLNDLYHVSLYVDGAWQTLQIDASMPDHSLGATTADPNQFWMPLYEKAIASLYGSYDAGDLILVMQSLTGSQELYGYSDASQALKDVQAGQPEEAGPTAPAGWYDATTGAPSSQGAANAFNLIDGHEYSVLSHTSGTLTLLNPWNNTADGVGQITLSNAAFLKLFGQFATLLPAGQSVDPNGQMTPP